MKHENEDAQKQQEVAAIMESINRVRHMLGDQAQAYVQQYWDHHFGDNRQSKGPSPLGVRVHYKNKDATSFSIQWYWNHWVKDSKGKTRVFSTYIRKGRTKNAYHPDSLLKYARDWETDLVLELEAEFASIREQLKTLNKAEAAVRKLSSIIPGDESETEKPSEPAE